MIDAIDDKATVGLGRRLPRARTQHWFKEPDIERKVCDIFILLALSCSGSCVLLERSQETVANKRTLTLNVESG